MSVSLDMVGSDVRAPDRGEWVRVLDAAGLAEVQVQFAAATSTVHLHGVETWPLWLFAGFDRDGAPVACYGWCWRIVSEPSERFAAVLADAQARMSAHLEQAFVELREQIRSAR